jgi:glutamate synthase domain-containing protein 2
MTLMQKAFWSIVLIGNPVAFYLASEDLALGTVLVVLIGVYTLVGLYDTFFSRHTLNRLYPVAAYMRYGLEFIRPEIQQYFVANNTEELPFNREERDLVYRRAQKLDDTKPFGTQRDISAPGYKGLAHSILPVEVHDDAKRVAIGGKFCKQPYSAARLNISAMSFGALSGNAITALNLGAKEGGFYHNTGEGGYSPYHKQGGDIVWQIGTGYFGCRTKAGDFCPTTFAASATLDQVKMIEIKISQGAKPSHGGVLPAAKVSKEIAEIRHVEAGKDVLSPPTHSAFSTPLELLDFVAQLRELSGGKPVGFKLCIGRRCEFMAICKAMLKSGITPDFITIDGAEGGTGAAPLEYSNRFGLPCIEGVNFVHNCLVGIGLRDQIKVIASGHTASGFHMVEKIAVGADLCNAARTMMLALGCIQSQSCNTNECPTGIATQNHKRGKALDIKSRHKRVANYQELTLHSFFELVGAMGFDSPDKLMVSDVWKRCEEGGRYQIDEIYPTLAPDELLGDEIPPVYAVNWKAANAESFHSQSM